MAESVERLLIRIDATTETLRRELKKADKAVLDSDNAMRASLKRMGDAWNRGPERWFQQNKAQIKLWSAAAVAGVGFATKAIIDQTDTYKDMQGQLKLVSGSQDELNKSWQESLAISNETGVALDATVSLYTRLTRSTKDLNLSQDERLRITESINKAAAISGASSEEAALAIRQYTQALQGGVLRAEEYNSVNEQTPYILDLLAESMNKTRGELRQMVVDGEVTSEMMANAMLTMSDRVDKEFAQLPEKVERATNRLSNAMIQAFGRADVDPLIGALNELTELVTDPATINGLTEVAGGIIKIGTAAIKAAAALPDFYRWLDNKSKDLASLQGRLYEIEGVMSKYNEREKETSVVYKQHAEEAARLRVRIQKLTDQINAESKARAEAHKRAQENVEITEDEVKARGVLAGKTEESAEAYAQLTDELNRGGKALEGFLNWSREQSKQTRDVIEALDFEIAQFQLSSREQFINAELRKAGANATEEQIEAIKAHAGQLFDLRNANEKVTEDITKQWGDARETLSEFFFEFAKDGNNAFDTLTEGFRSSIAKMVAEAAANEIFLQFGTAANALGFTGIGGAALGQVDGQTFSGIFSSLFSSESTGSQVGGSIGSSVGASYGADNSVDASSATADAAGGASLGGLWGALIAFGAGRVINDLESGRYSLGDVLTGNFANEKYSDELFGRFGDVLFPGEKVVDPLGVGDAINDLIGFQKGSNNAARGIFNLGTGEQAIAGIGKSFDEENVQAVTDVINVLAGLSEGLGGSNFAGNLKIGNRSGVKFDGKQYDDIEAFYQFAFDQIIQGATGLDSALRTLLLNFDGTAEEVLQMAGAVTSLHQNAQINTVAQALEDFASAAPTALQAYRDQTASLNTLITNFDGSAAAAQELAETLAQNKAAAYEYVISLQQVAEQMGLVTKAQADYFRESALSEDELFRKRVNERDFFRAILDEVTDPENAQQAFQKVAELNRQIFDMLERGADGALSATQQSLLGIQDGSATGTADIFATYIEDANAALQSIIGDTIGELQGTQEDMNARIATLLQNSAQIFQQASDTALQASQNMITAAQTMQSAADTLAGAAEVV